MSPRAPSLRRLSAHDFLPPVEQVAALNALTGTTLPTGRDDGEPRRDEVEAFAQTFWSLAPGERLVAWAELSRRGAAPGRLRELEPGLDVAAAPLADPVAEELAEQFRALFVLSPRARALRRNAWLLERAADAGKWRAALVAVQRDAPALVALEPQLRAALAPGFDLAALAEGAAAATRSRGPSVDVDVADFARRLRQHERTAVPEPDYEAADGAHARKILYGFPLLFFIGCCAVSGVFRDAGRNTPAPKLPSYSPAYPPGSSALPYPPPGERPTPPRSAFSAAEVAEFQQYERDKAAGRNVPEPLAYELWRLAGRSAGQFDPARTPIPKTGTRTVYLSDVQIRMCQFYDTARNGPPPDHFDDWVKAGRPTTAGVVRVPNNP